MYKKQIPCPECNGSGYVTGHDCFGRFEAPCPHCKGKRNIMVPMTRADAFRSMTDEELVDAIWYLTNSTFCQHEAECRDLFEESPDNDIPDEWCKKCLLEWLSKPADGTPIRFRFDDKQESGLMEED